MDWSISLPHAARLSSLTCVTVAELLRHLATHINLRDFFVDCTFVFDQSYKFQVVNVLCLCFRYNQKDQDYNLWQKPKAAVQERFVESVIIITVFGKTQRGSNCVLLLFIVCCSLYLPEAMDNFRSEQLSESCHWTRWQILWGIELNNWWLKPVNII